MEFEYYQLRTNDTAIYDENIEAMVDDGGFELEAVLELTYTALGLSGEAGEIANKVKKCVRGDYDPTDMPDILEDEIGDVLWYLAQLCEVLGLSLSDIAEENLRKLQSRQDRNVLQGSGDNR